MQFKVGEELIWMHQPKGGYGYVIPVPVVLDGFTKKQCRVTVKLKDGTSTTVFVKADNLRYPVAA